MNKHYIKTDNNNYIIKSFSDAFEQPSETDIFIENGGRHYNLDIHLDDMCPKYKYDNGIIESSEANRTAWRAENIEPIVDYDTELSTAIEAATSLEELKTALIGGGKAKIKGRKK